MSTLFNTYKRFPFEIISGEGVYLTDNHGKRYLDLTSGIGVCNLGYNVESLNQAVIQQLHRLWHTSNLYHSTLQEQVAAKLVKGKDQLVFFCNSGTEANEAAIKLARKYTGKHKLMAFHQSFHGRTMGALSITGNETIKSGFGRLLNDVDFIDYNEMSSLSAITSDYAAVFVEIIQGEGGVTLADTEWLIALEKQCQTQGVLLIVDEIQTGMGRTGKLFAHQHYGIQPDIITLAKGLANGLPCGAVIGKQKLGEAFQPGSHGSTFGGNPIAMAAANQVLDCLTPTLLEEVQHKAEWLFEKIEKELTALTMVKRVSGKGFMLGIQLANNVPVEEVLGKLHEKGILALSARGNTLRLLPPLIISKEELDKAITQIHQVLSAY
ncbi:acetylornithine transaminase [Rodentibacter trehalosifermentans]|uniref:Acetylornithine transaminase n=1 Tax=Rodentibacter trehalosifermentans TaxID=1908263 RepID=A0A1V3J1G6_9PAST|nr:acetylornithine transaminase [Rodentibacter trehalosifermentans]OOF48484.1 acetylornithine transaminase [Rodentibacter trehalosifermentans]OOF53226.1 acetylornithine transaminase [Rodentibacter trehalosifermentans]